MKLVPRYKLCQTLLLLRNDDPGQILLLFSQTCCSLQEFLVSWNTFNHSVTRCDFYRTNVSLPLSTHLDCLLFLHVIKLSGSYIKRLKSWYHLISISSKEVRCPLLLQSTVEFLTGYISGLPKKIRKCILQDSVGT